jgi:hypothetical protein
VQFAESAWKAWDATVSKTLANISTISAPLKLIGRDLSGFAQQIGAAAANAGNLAGGAPAVAGPGFFASLFGSSAQLGQQLSATILSAIQGGGNPVSAAAGLVGAKIGSSIAGSLTKEGGKLFNTALGGVLTSALPVIGSLVGPLAGALWGKLFGTAGRDKVKDFAASFGGFDALQQKMLTLGQDYDRLWRGLTQGVGRNNPKEAQAAIDAVTAAFARQEAATRAAEDAAIVQAEAQTEAARAAQAAIDAITGKIQSLTESIKDEAPEEVMGIIEANTRAQIAALEKERDAAQAAIDETAIAAAEAAKEAGDIIDTALAEREFRIRVRVNLDGLPGGAGGVIPMQHGGDFWVTKPTLFLAGEAGPERATFGGAGGRGGAPQTIITKVYLDRREIAYAVAQAARDEGLV